MDSNTHVVNIFKEVCLQYKSPEDYCQRGNWPILTPQAISNLLTKKKVLSEEEINNVLANKTILSDEYIKNLLAENKTTLSNQGIDYLIANKITLTNERIYNLLATNTSLSGEKINYLIANKMTPSDLDDTMFFSDMELKQLHYSLMIAIIKALRDFFIKVMVVRREQCKELSSFVISKLVADTIQLGIPDMLSEVLIYELMKNKIPGIEKQQYLNKTYTESNARNTYSSVKVNATNKTLALDPYRHIYCPDDTYCDIFITAYFSRVTNQQNWKLDDSEHPKTSFKENDYEINLEFIENKTKQIQDNLTLEEKAIRDALKEYITFATFITQVPVLTPDMVKEIQSFLNMLDTHTMLQSPLPANQHQKPPTQQNKIPVLQKSPLELMLAQTMQCLPLKASEWKPYSASKEHSWVNDKCYYLIFEKTEKQDAEKFKQRLLNHGFSTAIRHGDNQSCIFVNLTHSNPKRS